MTCYATLDYAKQQLKTSAPTGSSLTTDDARLLGYLRAVSLRLDSEFPLVPRWPYFAPWNGARKYRVTPQRVTSSLNTFQWKEPLLALTGDITLGSRTLTVGTDVELWPDASQPPFYALRLINAWDSWYDGCAGCAAPLQVTIPGLWGWQRDYASAWPTVTTLAAAVVSTSATTITLTSVTVLDPLGVTLAISPGALLRIDAEYLEVLLVNAATKVVTVTRGVNGTTAALHDDGASVDAWQVEAPVQQAVARQADLIYARLGAYTTVEVIGMSEVRYPADWLWEVHGMMSGYSYGD